MLRTEGPNPLASRHYAKDYNEVKQIGSLTSLRRTRTRRWRRSSGRLSRRRLRGLDALVLDDVRADDGPERAHVRNDDVGVGGRGDRMLGREVLLGLLATGRCDPERGRGCNPATEGDANWLPLFDPSTPTTPRCSTPGFPDHPSGHSCVSSSIMYALADFFGTDAISFDVASPRFPGQTRHFDSFSELTREIVDCRVWAGSTSGPPTPGRSARPDRVQVAAPELLQGS